MKISRKSRKRTLSPKTSKELSRDNGRIVLLEIDSDGRVASMCSLLKDLGMIECQGECKRCWCG